MVDEAPNGLDIVPKDRLGLPEEHSRLVISFLERNRDVLAAKTIDLGKPISNVNHRILSKNE